MLIYVAIAGFFTASVLRTLFERWRDRKPLSCDVCMSFWSTLIVYVIWFFPVFDVDFLASAGICLLVMRTVKPPTLPPL
jgi:hypothetical protein